MSCDSEVNQQRLRPDRRYFFELPIPSAASRKLSPNLFENAVCVSQHKRDAKDMHVQALAPAEILDHD